MRRNTNLRDFLQSRRARVTPAQAGVPLGSGPRRVPGLRREEVAQLAGISVDYYIRFEQGRVPNVSDAVLDAVVRVLHLTPYERRYLHVLTRPRSSHTPVPAGSRRVSHGLRLLLENLAMPAFVLGPQLDLLAVNDSARVLHYGLDTRGNYVRWLMLDMASRTLCADWEVATIEALAVLRFNSARHPHDPALAALVEELTAASTDFRRIWDTHEVDVPRGGERRYRHPVVGELVLHSERLDVVHDPDQALFTYSVVPGSSSDAGLRRLTRAAAGTMSPTSDFAGCP